MLTLKLQAPAAPGVTVMVNVVLDAGETVAVGGVPTLAVQLFWAEIVGVLTLSVALPVFRIV